MNDAQAVLIIWFISSALIISGWTVFLLLKDRTMKHLNWCHCNDCKTKRSLSIEDDRKQLEQSPEQVGPLKLRGIYQLRNGLWRVAVVCDDKPGAIELPGWIWVDMTEEKAVHIYNGWEREIVTSERLL